MAHSVLNSSTLTNMDCEVSHCAGLSGAQAMDNPDSTYQTWSEMFYNLQFDTDSDLLAKFFVKSWDVSLYYSLIYLILVFSGQRWMRNREPYNLRYPLAVWSGLLSIFSIAGTLVVWPEFLDVLYHKGLVASYCDNSYILNQQTSYWYTLFTLSKVAELLDTGFIVLRKQKLILLHWVHHVLTLVYSFYVFPDKIGTARWMVCMNFLIHAFMYGYYSLKALRFHIPRRISIIITTSQILQMIFGFAINTHVIFKLTTGSPCQCTMRSVFPGFMMYSLYFYFFVKFFIDSYLLKKSPALRKKHHTNGLKQVNNDFNNNQSQLYKKIN